MILWATTLVIFENQGLAPLDLMAFFFGGDAGLWRQVPRLLLHTGVSHNLAIPLYRFMTLFFSGFVFVLFGGDDAGV